MCVFVCVTYVSIYLVPCFLFRLVWLLIVVGAFASFTAIIVSRVVHFYSYPKTVNVEVIFADSLRFPAVTICNQNFMRYV